MKFSGATVKSNASNNNTTLGNNLTQNRQTNFSTQNKHGNNWNSGNQRGTTQSLNQKNIQNRSAGTMF